MKLFTFTLRQNMIHLSLEKVHDILRKKTTDQTKQKKIIKWNLPSFSIPYNLSEKKPNIHTIGQRCEVKGQRN